ncbi:MAG TPA: MdtA/MuxA family multidrug efflux RND transporter periplasmic adaptor subunit [Burkholderiaceae bacterium]|nr:MdtA/MuxA family multidrug efflux RND transporter periplasmic adaptor subunit [Burkholderiaceae bacterium]
MRTWLIAALALLLVVGAVAWWRSSHQAGNPDSAAGPAQGPGGGPGGRRFAGANRVQPVSVAAVRRQDIRVNVPAIGTIAAANTAVVHAKVDAELIRLHFTEGQPVKAGQLLAELDPRSFDAALQQAQGQLARDEAQLANARVDVKRYRELLAKDAIASQQVDTQEALVRQLQGTVEADRAQVATARLQLSYTRITAPIAGLAGLRQVDLGNQVHASDTNGILTIAQTQPVNVVFAVPETHLTKIVGRLREGQTLNVEAWDAEQKQRLAVGRVATTDNAIDTTTGTIKLKATFANDDNRLFPNQFVNVRLQLDTLKGSLAVPSTAVLRGAQGSFVYLLKDDGSVTVRNVSVDATDGDWVAVKGDLQPGDKLVTDGTDRLREGAKVEVIAPDDKLRSLAQDAGAGRRHGGASAPFPAASGASGAASDAERPRWLDRLPPDVAERVMKMSPQERQAWIEQRRAARAASSSQ